MRRLLVLCPLLFGCPPPPGYHINLNVTVPPEVQSKFSSAKPGLLMTGGILLAQFCDPSDVPFNVSISMWRTGKCATALAPSSQSAYAIGLSASDIEWFGVNEPGLKCGQTRSLIDSRFSSSVWTRDTQQSWGPEHAQAVATGSGGSCGTDGNYEASIVLQLKN